MKNCKHIGQQALLLALTALLCSCSTGTGPADSAAGDKAATDHDDSSFSANCDVAVIEAAGEPLFVGDSEYIAYPVEACSTQVPLTPGQRSYFLFSPTEAGTYEISVSSEAAGFGYYGTPFYVLESSIGEMVGDTMVISLSQDMLDGNTMVFGIDSDTAETAVLSILRIGEPQWTIETDPWDVYRTTAVLAPYKLPAGQNVVPFDLTASTDTYSLVYNGADGFYHLDSADGPLVMVFLGKDCKYVDCFQTIMTRTGVKRYFFDADGSLLKKEDYDPCLREYFEYMDEDSGVYPLTEDLKYIIRQWGDAAGWWDLDSDTSVFRAADGSKVSDINTEIAWLLMCGYTAS